MGHASWLRSGSFQKSGALILTPNGRAVFTRTPPSMETAVVDFEKI